MRRRVQLKLPALMGKSGSQRAFGIPDGSDMSCTCSVPERGSVFYKIQSGLK